MKGFSEKVYNNHLIKSMRDMFKKAYSNSLGKFIIEMLFFVLPVVFIIRTFVFGLYQVPSESMETTFLKGERFFADKMSYWVRKPQRGEIVAFNDPIYEDYSKNYYIRLLQRYFNFKISLWTKRVIAVEGDHIRGTIENGKPVIYLNGVKLDETAYINRYPIISVKVKPLTLMVGNRSETIDHQYKSYDPNIPFGDKQPFYNIKPENIWLNPITHQPRILWPDKPNEGGKDIFEYTLGKNQYFLRGDNRRGSCDSTTWGVLNLEFINGRIVYRIISIDTDESWLLLDILKNPISFWKKIRWSRCFNFIK